MEVREEADGVFRIPVHNPFGVHPTNVYLLVGDRAALFDVGPAHRRTWEDLTGALSHLAKKPEDIELVVVSHGHADHDGLAHRFAWASILIGEADLTKIADYDGYLDRYETAVRSVLPAWGVSTAVADTIPRFFDWLHEAGAPAPWADKLQDGMELAGLGASWRVVALPGHTEGLIGLYREADRVLISSDQLLEKVVPNPGFCLEGTACAGYGMADYERSLRRLLGLSVERVLPGHGPCFGDCAVHVTHFLALYERRLDQALAALEGESTVHQVAERLFPGCDPANSYHVFVIHLEAAARLSVLLERGRVSREAAAVPAGADRYVRSRG